MPTADKIRGLVDLYDATPDLPRRRSFAVSAVHGVLRGRVSELIDQERWEELGFAPEVRAVTRRGAALRSRAAGRY